jgi:hypothetical protein
MWFTGPTQLYQKSGDILLIAKAFNGRVIMQWLTETLTSLPEPFAQKDDRTPVVTLAMHLACNYDL